MNYSDLFFGKADITLLTISDIEEFFSTEKDESDKIEYKSYVINEKDAGGHDGKEKGALKTICGFLNSEGGILIWGAPNGRKIEGRRSKIFKGELSPLTHRYEKDEFIAKVTNRITPASKGIKFHSIQKGENFVYVIEVPRSEYAPHQFENVYYMRLDGQTVAAPHHYIEALFKKISFPNIEGYLQLEDIEINGNDYRVQFNSFFFNKSALQNESNLSYRILCDIGIFLHQNGGDLDKRLASGGHEFRAQNAKEVLHYGEPFTEQHTIVINRNDLHNNHYEVTLILSFGGKSSPMRFSDYKFEIGRMKNHILENYVLKRNENVYAYERKSQSGLSEDESIKKIIGRK